METETTALASKRKQHILVIKREQTQTLKFFLVFRCISNMLVHWVTSSLRPPLERSPKIEARKLSSPYIAAARVQLYVFTSLRLASTSQKTRVVSFLSCRGWQKNIRFRWFHTCEKDFEPPGFFLVIFNYHECCGLAIRRLSA